MPFRGLFNMPFGSFAQIGEMGYFFMQIPLAIKKIGVRGKVIVVIEVKWN